MAASAGEQPVGLAGLSPKLPKHSPKWTPLNPLGGMVRILAQSSAESGSRCSLSRWLLAGARQLGPQAVRSTVGAVPLLLPDHTRCTRAAGLVAVRCARCASRGYSV
jgi:hypothetical protein